MIHFCKSTYAVFKNGHTGNLAVIGKMFKVGKHNAFIDKLIAAGLPKKAGDHSSSHDFINLNDVLGSTSAYYTYPGSLTTPPCSEIVTWFVLKDKATLSENQYAAYQRYYGE